MRTCVRLSMGSIGLGAMLSLSSCGESIPYTDINTYSLPQSSPPLYRDGERGFLNVETALESREYGLNWPNLALSGGLRLDTHFLAMGSLRLTPEPKEAYEPRIHGTTGMVAVGFSTYKQALLNKFLFDLYLGASWSSQFSQEAYEYYDTASSARYHWTAERYFVQGVLWYRTDEATSLFATGQIGGMSVNNFRVIEQNGSSFLPRGLPLDGIGYTPSGLSAGFEIGREATRFKFSVGVAQDQNGHKDEDPDANWFSGPLSYEGYLYATVGIRYYFSKGE